MNFFFWENQNDIIGHIEGSYHFRFILLLLFYWKRHSVISIIIWNIIESRLFSEIPGIPSERIIKWESYSFRTLLLIRPCVYLIKFSNLVASSLLSFIIIFHGWYWLIEFCDRQIRLVYYWNEECCESLNNYLIVFLNFWIEFKRSFCLHHRIN